MKNGLKIIFSIFIFLFLFGCSIFFPKPSDPIPCDDLSLLGHNWYSLMKDQGMTSPIGRGVINIYENEKALSTLKIKRKNSKFKRKIFGTVASNNRTIKINKPIDDVVIFLIPPEVASEYYNQLHYQAGRNPVYLASPMFAAVPKEAFYDGTCRSGNEPFIITAIENRDSAAPAQFNISRENMYDLVSGLFLDPKSFDIEYLRSLILNTPQVVDLSTWGGWIDIDVDYHQRTFFHWLFNRPEGLKTDLDGIQRFSGKTIPPSIRKLLTEHSRLGVGWVDTIKEYLDSTTELNDEINILVDLITNGTITNDRYVELNVSIINKLENIEDAIEKYRIKMLAEQGLFISNIESDLYIETMRDYLETSKNRFNEIAQAYQRATQINSGQLLPIKDLLYGATTIVNGNPQHPSKPYKFGVGGGRHGVSPSLTATAYIFKSSDERFAVQVNGISNLTQVINAGARVLSSEVRRIESCSKKVRFIDLGISDELANETYIKPIKVGLQARSCWSFDVYYPCGFFKLCKKRVRGWTKLYDTTARGSITASAIRLVKDFKLKYGYRICVHGFICKRDDWQTEPLLASLSKDQNYGIDLIKKFGISVDRVALGYDEKNDKYLAVQLKSKELSPEEAVDLLTLIKLKTEQGN